MPFVKVGNENSGDINLHYEDYGQGKPVILIHGWPLSSASWEKQVPALVEAGYRVIAYDRRGFGKSSQPFSGYDADTLASDLHALILKLDLRDISLIGFSMGGGEVARYMSRHGGKGVAKAALVSSVVPFMLQTPDNPQGTPKSTFDAMTRAMKEDRAKFFAGFFKDFFGVSPVAHRTSDETLEWARAVSMQAGLKATLDCAAAFATTDFRPDLASFDVPTLIIHGTADKTVPIDAAGRAAAKGIKGSVLLEYEGAPHGLFATEKERFTNDLLAFVRD
jgi:non-heme chloroperoxidase